MGAEGRDQDQPSGTSPLTYVMSMCRFSPSQGHFPVTWIQAGHAPSLPLVLPLPPRSPAAWELGWTSIPEPGGIRSAQGGAPHLPLLHLLMRKMPTERRWEASKDAGASPPGSRTGMDAPRSQGCCTRAESNAQVSASWFAC